MKETIFVKYNRTRKRRVSDSGPVSLKKRENGGWKKRRRDCGGIQPYSVPEREKRAVKAVLSEYRGSRR